LNIYNKDKKNFVILFAIGEIILLK